MIYDKSEIYREIFYSGRITNNIIFKNNSPIFLIYHYSASFDLERNLTPHFPIWKGNQSSNTLGN